MRRARRRSSAVMGSSARYFSMMVSSKLETTSMSWWRASSASAARLSGTSRVSHSSPMSADQTRAFSSSRSMTPLNSDSAPMGSWMTAGRASRRSRIISTVRSKSAPMRSILLTKQMRGHVVLVGLAPHRLGLGLHAGHGVEDGDGAVEDAQRALHLDGEVDVARGVDDVDPVVAPRAGGGGRGDGDAALLLLDHPVHGGGAFVDLADLVVAPRVIEDALGRGGLARVDVGHDPDVAGLGQREVACGEGFSHGCMC